MRLSTEKAIEFVENLEKYHPIQKFWDESNERHRQEKNTENYPYSYFRGVLIRKIAEIIEALQQEKEKMFEDTDSKEVKRELKADLKFCDRATQGPWRHEWNPDYSEVKERADKYEGLVRELLYAVDIACRLASDYRMEAEYGVAVKREYTKREQYKLIDDIVYRAEEVLRNE